MRWDCYDNWELILNTLSQNGSGEGKSYKGAESASVNVLLPLDLLQCYIRR
jgi:hypothetical protein